MAFWIMEINGRVVRIPRRESSSLQQEVTHLEEVSTFLMQIETAEDRVGSLQKASEFKEVPGLTPIIKKRNRTAA